MCDPNTTLGCYDKTKALSDGLLLPKAAIKFQTKFYLYTNGFPATSIYYDKPASISNSHFDGNYDTKIIIHGFGSSSSEQWVHDMKNAFKIKGKFNIILVDWRHGAEISISETLGYSQASINTRVVGNEVGKLIEALPTNKSKVHLIGHSLGAHVSSFASKWLIQKSTLFMVKIDHKTPVLQYVVSIATYTSYGV